jgi:hypothetical protein
VILNNEELDCSERMAVTLYKTKLEFAERYGVIFNKQNHDNEELKEVLLNKPKLYYEKR